MMPPAKTRSSKVSRRTLAVITAVVLVLVGIVIVAVAREATSRRLVAAALSRPAAPARPPLTREEEAYVQALWPIHGAVERSAARMSLGQIFYVTKDLAPAEVKARVDDALTTYRRAGNQLGALEPPPSLQRAHEDYTAAVRLFERSAVAALGVLVNAGALRADDNRNNNGDNDGGSRPGQGIPPQTLPQGFESHS